MALAATSTQTARPATLAEARDVVRSGIPARQRMVFRGAGTKLDWAATPADVDLVVDSTGLDGLIAHNAGDMTAAVGAGMPLERLQGILGEAGQWLALDPPTERHGATIGGLLAAADAGPRRLRYGSMRDLVIGVTLVLSDGAVARAGGHVIKNVAGYDLAKLFYGSLGTLGMIAEVVVRLHPRPPASRTFAGAADAATATLASLALLASSIEPSSIEWSSPDAADGILLVRLEGSSAGVDGHTEALLRLLADHGIDAHATEGDDEAAVWQGHATDVFGSQGDTVVRAGTLPSRLPEVAAALREAAGREGVGAALTSSAGGGLHTCRFSGGDVQSTATAFGVWRSKVLELGGNVLLRRHDPELESAVDPLGPPPSGVTLLRAVKKQLDPDGRCAPGRFGSWY